MKIGDYVIVGKRYPLMKGRITKINGDLYVVKSDLSLAEYELHEEDLKIDSKVQFIEEEL